jgi:Ca-activated chloride channel family protein
MRWEDHDRPGTGPNRIQTIKPILQNFVEQRTRDRIGVVLFGRQAFTLSPLTFDHDWIERQLSRVEIGMVNANGTVIGDGLGTALNRLAQEKRTEAGRRRGAFVVLMTDGGESIVDGKPLSSLVPLEAAQIAKAKNIPVYCIGVGRPGFAWAPIEQTNRYVQRPADLDEGLLYEIASKTGGRFFRAEDKDTTQNAFKAIDRAQKIEFQAKSYLVTTELFWWLAAPGLGIFTLGAALARPAWRKEVVAA